MPPEVTVAVAKGIAVVLPLAALLVLLKRLGEWANKSAGRSHLRRWIARRTTWLTCLPLPN